MSFEIIKPTIKVEDTIHYLVTRPVVPVVDDGNGNYNISPIGFPVRDTSSELGVIPTRITPEFVATYNNLMNSFNVSYTSNKPISELYGSITIQLLINTLTYSSGTVTATSLYKHGYINGASVTISGVDQLAYNGTFTISVVDAYTFTYSLGSIPSSFTATGNKKSSYTLSVGDVVELVAQDDNKANGYYIVESYVWRTLYLVSKSAMLTKANIYTNVNIASAVAPLVTSNIASITSEATGPDIKSAVVITTVAHGFASGSSITISGSSVSAYNGIKTIDVVNAYTFRYSIPSLQATDSSGLATASYQTVTDDLVLLLNQSNTDENGIYYVKSGSQWDYFGDFYKYNGTENDNVAGDYGNLSDVNGNKLTHYRNGYSLKETADFLRKKLDSSIEFGKFAGKTKDIDKQGALVQWLLSGRKINIGKTADKSIIVDGFGLGNTNSTLRNNRTWGEIDPFDVDAINAEQTIIAKQKQTALWGLTNHHSRTLEGYNDKSPYVKDYPFVYNSTYDAGEIEPQLTGGHIDLDVDVERMRLSATGTTSTTDTNIRPIAIDTIWYHRENSYHNNITLDRSNANVFGKHAISLINNFDTPDFVAIYDQKFTSDNVTIGHSTYIELDDVSEFYAGDYIRFIFPIGTDSVDGIDQSTTYKIANGYPSGHTIKIINIDNSEVATTYEGSGTFTIQRVAFDLYTDNEVVTSLNNLCSIVLNSGDVLCLKTTTGTVTKYYIKPRSKRSLASIATKGSWSATTLSYDANGTNGINIYLNSSESDYVTFTHNTKTTAELLSDLNYNNDLIPVPFSASTNPIHLTELFVRNSLVDYSDDVYNSEKIRSKKTFIHLPTSLDLKDGTPIELDISLPTVPNTDSFKFNTVGSLSGYKNYVTQPRAYVFGGYHKIKCDLVPVISIISNGMLATLTTETPHELHTATFNTTDIDISNSSISVSNWKNIDVGELVTFDSAGTLPTTSPQIVADTKYKIKSIVDGRITLSTTSNVDIAISSVGVGTQYITLCKPVKITIKGSFATEYNDTFTGRIYTRSKIEFSVDSTYSTSVTNENIFISKSVIVNGTEGTYGLTERNNNAIFGSMPESEYASENNIYHQTFTPDNIVGSSYTDSDGVSQIDKRVLLATVYPTSTSTFQWRMDNDPQLRMLQWSMLNVNAGGGSDETGSFANVAYKRNKAIFNEFSALYKDGDNGLFSVYNNPLSYVSLLSPDFTQQQINAMVKVRFPETIGTMLDTVSAKTVGSFNYQANSAYIDLIRDFLTTRVRINDVRESDDYIYILQESTDLILAEDENDGALIIECGAVDTNIAVLPIISYATSLPLNHGSSSIPTSFYDHTFFKVDSLVNPYSIAIGDDADSRWSTKEIYVPEYIYNASGDTAFNDDNVFHNMPSALTTHMETYYFNSDKYSSNSGDRYVVGDLSPSIDPVFAFGYATSNKFISFITDTTIASKVNDVKRKLWDSYFEIPNARQRQMQNAYYIDAFGATVEDTVKFHGAYWIPFAKMFSTDGINPINPNIIDITSYNTITGGSYANVNSTLNELLKSNPIATRFIEHGYEDAFASVNSRETVTANEEFIRNYVAGYSNKLPLRFYNGYKIMIAGNLTSTSYETDLSNPVVITEIDSERIYRYSLRDYLTEYSESPSVDNGMYMDDNFLISNTPDVDKVTVRDQNPAWWYFDNGNPNIMPTSSTIKSAITVSGMNYLADRKFYINKMEFNYTRIKMSFVFSAELGRWMPLDYRQAPTSYLTPTFGATALGEKERSIVYAGTTGKNAIDYVPIEYTVDNNVVNTIEDGSYPTDVRGNLVLDYLWKNPLCTDSSNVYTQLSDFGYWEMPPMELNPFCYPFLSDELPYNSDGTLVDEMNYSQDVYGSDIYRFTRLLEPNKASPIGINFAVPNNVHGGEFDANNDLFMYQPHIWKVYWHMRPVVCSMDGTDIPTAEARTGGVMADPVLNNIYTYPNPRDPQYYIPWHEDMNTDWLNAGWLISDGKIRNDSNSTRDEYYEFDGD